MQLTIKNILLVFCFLQTLKIESLVWAQDAAIPKSSVEQTTQANSLEAGKTAKPNSFENLASSELIEEQGTSTIATVNSCERADTSETCDCNCSNNKRNQADSAEVTTTQTNSEEKTTVKPSEESVNESAETTKASAEVPASSTEKSAPTFTCETAGNFAHSSDCRRYYNCYPITNSTEFEVTENVCPEGQAFNTEFSSCMRDLSSCKAEHGGFECSKAGLFADPQNNAAAYYRCMPRLGEQLMPTFHVFHVNCGVGKIFMPELGKCFYDLNAPLTAANSKENNGMPDDEQLVKAELKQWKLREKTKLKEEKLKQKYEKKLQKELAKKVSKEAKEKAKKEMKSKKDEKKKFFDDDDD